MKGGLVRIFATGGFAYIAYHIVESLRMEKIVKQSKIIRETKLKYNIELSPDKEEKLAKAEKYLREHQGMRMLNRIKTEQFFEEKLQAKMKERQAMMEAAKEDPVKLQKLKSELEELQKAYTSINPKKIVTVEDLK